MKKYVGLIALLLLGFLLIWMDWKDGTATPGNNNIKRDTITKIQYRVDTLRIKVPEYRTVEKQVVIPSDTLAWSKLVQEQSARLNYFQRLVNYQNGVMKDLHKSQGERDAIFSMPVNHYAIDTTLVDGLRIQMSLDISGFVESKPNLIVSYPEKTVEVSHTCCHLGCKFKNWLRKIFKKNAKSKIEKELQKMKSQRG